MRVAAALLALSLLSACEAGAPAPLPGAEVRAEFPPGGVVNVIQVTALDPRPLHAAELVAPDGAATPATGIDTTKNPTTSAGQFGAGNTARNNLSPQRTFANAVVPPNPTYSGRPSERTELLLTRSVASIALPDPVAYRKDWQHYRIKAEFGTPPAPTETIEIPAPEPPPAQ